MWQERAGSLSDRLVLAESKLAMLEAPQQPQEPVLGASGAMESPNPSGEPAPQPDPSQRHYRRRRTSVAGGSGWLTCSATGGEGPPGCH